MNRHLRLYLGLAFICGLVLPTLARAGVDTAWVRRYDGPAHLADYATCLAVDSQGNVIVTGASQESDSTYDWITIKYSSNGDSLWADRRSYGGGKPVSMRVDVAGNVYVGGSGNGRLATVKYSPTGNVVWALPYGPQDSVGMGGLAFDVNGNLMLSGGLRRASWDALLVKYRPSGDTAWVRTYDVGGYDNSGDALVCDRAGGTYVAGSYLDGVPREHCVMFRCDSMGNRLWTALFADSAKEDWLDNIALDRDGNAVAIGKYIGTTTSYDYLTIKCDPQGETLWTRTCDGPAHGEDRAVAVATAGGSGMLVTGFSYDPSTKDDYVTIKYDALGNMTWMARYDSPSHNYDDASALTVDESGSSYVTGRSRLGSTAPYDYLTVAYDHQGDTLWTARYRSPGQNGYGAALTVDPQGNVYVTGGSDGIGSGSDFATIKYVQSGGVAEERVQPVASRFSLVAEPSVFRRSTTVRFCARRAAAVRVMVFDAEGRRVRTLMNCSLRVGAGTITWDGCDERGARLPPGVYIVVLEAGEERTQVKVVMSE